MVRKKKAQTHSHAQCQHIVTGEAAEKTALEHHQTDATADHITALHSILAYLPV